MSGSECEETSRLERKTLLLLLSINASMFLAEALAGWIGESTGLLADSLDMFADASVYVIALHAVGRSGRLKQNAALASGVVQVALGLGVFAEVLRRLFAGSEPVSVLMMVVGTIAFAANTACLALISGHREGGVHMRAAWIFSANDVIANIGVVFSGVLVMMLDSRIPDLVIGALVSLVVITGGVRIVREARETPGY